MMNSGNDRSLRRASVVAGAGLAAMAVLAGFANFGVLDTLVTEGDPALTAKHVLAAAGLFRAGIVALFVVALLDVVVASALFRVFAPVSRTLSALGAWLRLAYAAVFWVAISELVGVLPLLRDPAGAEGTAQAHGDALSRIGAFDDLWHTGLILFACHLLVIGYLAYRSGYVPRVFGILLVLAGLGYLVDGFGAILVEDYSLNAAGITFVGEVALIFWLLIKGSRMALRRDAAPA